MVLLKRKGKVYCICRKPDDGSFMVQCDSCKEWFHGKCVHITQEQADKLTRYACATCKRRKNSTDKPSSSSSSSSLNTSLSSINTLNTNNIANTVSTPPCINQQQQQQPSPILLSPPNTTLSSPPPSLHHQTLITNTPYPLVNTTSQSSPHTPHSPIPFPPTYVNTTSTAFSPLPSPSITPLASPSIFPTTTDTDMPFNKRHRMEGDLSTHSHISPLPSPTQVSQPDREKFWEIIRRSRGQV